LARVGRRLAAVGVTGITDATAGLDGRALDLLTAAVGRGDVAQRLVVLGPSHLPEPGHPRLTLGPWKLVLDEADEGSFEPGEIADTIAAAHETGRAVANNCVSGTEVVVAVSEPAWCGTVC